MKRKILISLLFCCFAICIFGQNTNDNSATESHEISEIGIQDAIAEPDRTAEDFIFVSLCIADPTDWREDVLGVVGHAFLRLQCPYYGLDYCFSYEGENVNDNLNDYLSGNSTMGLFAIPTMEYLQDYRNWGRNVEEYYLHLSPSAEQRLWQIMDNHLTHGANLAQNLTRYGCLPTIVKYVKLALDSTQIKYASLDEFENKTSYEIFYETATDKPWARLASAVFLEWQDDSALPEDEKILVPAEILKLWNEATIEGEPLIINSTTLVEGKPKELHSTIFSPMFLAILLLLISLAAIITEKQYLDWLLLILQTLVGIFLIYYWLASGNANTNTKLLLILFNPLPCLLWKFRAYWGLIYSLVLATWLVVMFFLPHMLFDPALLVLALSYIVMFAKYPIKKYITTRK